MTAYTEIAARTKEAAKRIPVNALGLLEGIYRPDLLPKPQTTLDTSTGTAAPTTPDAFDQSTSKALVAQETDSFTHHIVPNGEYEQALRVAYVPMEYEEGYPTLDGRPFWSQLQFEPVDAYQIFQLYLYQTRVTTLATKARDMVSMRQMHLLLEETAVKAQGLTVAELNEFYHTYYWAQRAKAYDMYHKAHEKRVYEMRGLEVEEDHFLFATRLMETCKLYLDENEEELLETMTPKAFLDMLKTAATMQRISVRLPANGPAAKEDVAPGGSVELIMRSVAQQMNGASGNTAVTNTKQEANSKLAKIFENQDILGLAQELILRVTSGPQTAAQGG